MQKEKIKSWYDLIFCILSFIIDLFKKKKIEQEQQTQLENQQYQDSLNTIQQQYNQIQSNLENNENKINNSNLQNVSESLNNRF